MRLPRLLVVALVLFALPVAAGPLDDGERDDAIFGDDDGDGDDGLAAAAAGTPTDDADGADDADDSTRLGDPRLGAPAVENREALADKLQIGGLLYLRHGLFFNEETDLGKQSYSNNNLTDVYFDARPNDRVRAFLRGRMTYTPTTSGSTTSAFFGLGGGGDEVQVLLDEMWLKWDIGRQVYLTLGRQHVHWGTTRLWNPVDVIYSARRNPLTLYDQRTGLPMLKVQVPIGSLGWNAYGLLIADSATDIETVAAAGRLEMVLGTAELGLTAMKRKGLDPRFGLDLSMGLWDLDLSGELGVRLHDGEPAWMVSAGLSWQVQYNDEDSLIFGVEGFHNPDGKATVDDVVDPIVAGLMAAAQQAFIDGTEPQVDAGLPFTPFYVGRWYAAFFAVAMGPGSWDDTSFTLSAIANLSDRTGFLRLDVRTLVLTDLSLELYGGLNVGADGEFRYYARSFEEKLNAAIPAGLGIPAVEMPRPAAQVGVNLRVPF